ncbi:hypothetical protein, partial [Mesorhizobium sp. M1A.F.Ca.ET.072.01.1.1]|uniref:hypothetical protein n=1 Tax=Mesorhizobium sp. M1A.F.Ca.ET.072.01.1.1 TaxID=2496753 RepID=UPI001AEC9230
FCSAVIARQFVVRSAKLSSASSEQWLLGDVEGDCDLPTASERDLSVGPAKGLLDLPIRQGASFRAPGSVP